MRPLLLPGIHVLRRGDDRLQVGLDRDHAVVLPDTAEVRRELRLLNRGDLTAATVLEALGDLLAEPRPGRPAGRVAVTAFGHPLSERLNTRLRILATAAGHRLASGSADVAVVAGVGEPAREVVDRWAQKGTPHVLVRLVEGYAVVGPFVVPGSTACVRCVDAHATDDDPAWPLLLAQYTALSARDRPDGTTEPFDPALAELACAWAARDVASYLDGHRPSTWSATVRLDPLLHDIRTQEWLRHPHCGCSWEPEASPGSKAL